MKVTFPDESPISVDTSRYSVREITEWQRGTRSEDHPHGRSLDDIPHLCGRIVATLSAGDGADPDSLIALLFEAWLARNRTGGRPGSFLSYDVDLIGPRAVVFEFEDGDFGIRVDPTQPPDGTGQPSTADGSTSSPGTST